MRNGKKSAIFSIRKCICGSIGVFYFTSQLSSPAFAASSVFNILSTKGFALGAVLVSILVFIWALVVVRKLTKAEITARSRMKYAETRLNQAEAILNAEPGILLVWKGRQDEPNTMIGQMPEDVEIPRDVEDLLAFKSWLNPESAETLEGSLASLRLMGTPFNIGISTLKGQLLEADGRTAGGTATLRFRALIGERRSNTELTHETRRLGKQVERLSSILDHTPFPIWLDDKNGNMIWINDAYMNAVEATSVEQVLSLPIKLIDEAKIKPIENTKLLSKSIKGRVDAIIAGNRRTMDVFKVEGEQETANFAVDMTSLDEAQRELDLHIKAHASTLNNLAMAIAIFGPDQNLRFYNAAYAELWDFDTNWLDGHPKDGEILDKLRADRRLPEQANYRSWKTDILSAYKTLETQENWWHLPDGQSLRVIAEQHPFGGVTYLYENVTEKIDLESRYNALLSVQSETLNSLGEGVALYGTDGKLQLFNTTFSRFWGLSEEFLLQKPHIDDVILQCLPLFNDTAVWDDLKYCITSLNNKRKSFIDRVSREDKKLFDCAAIPLPGGNTLVTFVDVTDSAGIERALRERNEALEAADRLKTNFLSNVSYELRTPLTNILGFAEGLSMGIAGELKEKQQEYLGHIQVSSNDLLSIIDAILDLTTIDAGAMELKLTKIDVASLLEKTARSLSDKIKRLDLTLNIELAENVTSIIGDEHRLAQIFENLLTNAIGFSPAKSIVRFGARLDGDDILIWVADSGRGMDPDFQKRAFDRFQSIPISGGHRGPGLGLAIVKSFVELHDGQVSLLSKLDKGTTVICRLPIKGPKQDSEPAPSIPSAIPPAALAG